MKRWIFSIAGALVMVITSWLFGNDLSHRGYSLGMTFLIACAVFVVVATHPCWSDE